MTTINNTSNIFDNLPNELLQNIFLRLDLNDLLPVSRVCKLFHNNISENALWKAIAERISCPINPNQPDENVRQKVINNIFDLKQDIRNLNESLPDDIKKIIDDSQLPSYQEIQLLKDYQKARDTKVVWETLASIIINNPGNMNFKTSKEMFDKVNGFDKWCSDHQTQLQAIIRLDLSYYKQLSSLPKEIGQLNQLQELLVINNNLTSLPKEIGQLNQLTTLDVSNNKLTSLPSEIGQLPNLINFKFENNEF